jgi:RHS repeat-associated protein
VRVHGTGTQDNRYKFSGKRRDSETGLDHSLYRKFHPNLGRWLSADPVRGWPGNPQSPNLYTYVGNHPTNRVDPMGDLAIPKGCQGAIGPMWVPWLDGLTLIDGFDFTSGGSNRLPVPMCVDGAWEGDFLFAIPIPISARLVYTTYKWSGLINPKGCAYAAICRGTCSAPNKTIFGPDPLKCPQYEQCWASHNDVQRSDSLP